MKTIDDPAVKIRRGMKIEMKVFLSILRRRLSKISVRKIWKILMLEGGVEGTQEFPLKAIDDRLPCRENEEEERKM